MTDSGFPVFEDGPTPSVAAILFEIREQHQIGTSYKFRYSQTEDTGERAAFVRKWKGVQESKYYLKAACQVVWMREEQAKAEKTREEERRKREEEARRRREEEREREREEERRREVARLKLEQHHHSYGYPQQQQQQQQPLAPWWVRAAMVQIPPAIPEEPIEVTMEDHSDYNSYTHNHNYNYNHNHNYSHNNYNYGHHNAGYHHHSHHQQQLTTTTPTSPPTPTSPTSPPTSPSTPASVVIPSPPGWCTNEAELCPV